MALQKEIELEGNITIKNAYHRIISFEADAFARTLQIEIAIYKDKATRNADERNYIPRATKRISIQNHEGNPNTEPPVPPTNDFNTFFITSHPEGSIKDSIYASMYIYIKANNDYYSDAEDV